MYSHSHLGELERIEETIECLIEIHGRDSTQWPQAAKEEALGLLTEAPKLLRGELSNLTSRFSQLNS